MRVYLVCYFYFLAMLSLAFQSSTVSAHNVVSGAYADGMIIEGEIGFSNGDMAQAGSPVNVYDAEGELIAELTLAEGGVFTYEAKTATKHIFKSNLSAGHVAEMIIEANELTAVAASGIVPPAASSAALPASVSASDKPASSVQLESVDRKLVGNITAEQLESIVRSAVAQQVRPLQKELRAYKEKVMFRDIAGGLGFIFGLFGAAAWMASKSKKGDKNATVS